MKRLILTVVGLIVAIALSFVWYQSVHAPVEFAFIELTSPDGDVVQLQVEVADDAQERMTGLMNRNSLPDGQGMVFVFDEPAYPAGGLGELSFWMKNTLIPLDILYFDNDGKFVSRTTMSPCVTQECPLYPSAGPASFALEVNAGEVRTASVGEGWMLDID